MEYYLYISDSKVNMLFSQLPKKASGKIAGELGVNVGIVKATMKSEMDVEPGADNIARLQAVVRHIRKSADLGTIDNPSTWIQDVQYARVVTLRTNDRIVFFVGESPSRVRFALGGSAAHLTSGPRPEGVTIGWSFLPFLLRGLENVVRGSRIDGIETITNSYESEWMELIAVAERSALEPEIKISFLAKRLLAGIGENDGMAGVLATPLYVSMAD